MGCWYETCAVTHTKIYEGQEAVMLVLTREGIRRGAESCIWGYYDIVRSFESVHVGTYNDYGWLKEVDDAPNNIDASDEEAYHNRPYTRAIFVHKNVWDSIIKSVGLEHDDQLHFDAYCKIYDKPPFPFGREVTALCKYAYEVRLNLVSSITFKGCQHGEDGEYDAWLKLCKDTAKKNRAWFKKECGDY